MLILERDTLCAGMTGKSSGIVRCHYGVPSLAAMARYGVEVFTHADEMFGTDIGWTTSPASPTSRSTVTETPT